MSNLEWELVPRSGIKSATITITFGMHRQELRSLMAKSFLPPEESDYSDEDDFLTQDGSTFIRVRYNDTEVQDIEFLKGSLSYDGSSIHSAASYAEIEERFKSKGLTLRYTEWLGDGQDCLELGINIATHEDVGGDGDGIEWVILSSKFK